MSWPALAIFMISASIVECINRPVYKVVLAQKGYAQFLQYDVETPPLREFTFCTWIRVYDLSGDQTIFTYVANGNNRVVRLWLDSGGQQMKISINGKVTSSTSVDIVKDVWRHVCLSYQADFGVWALYIDARLVSCEAAHSLYGYVLPGGGSVIIGYGTADNGAPNGFEGEIFGANMILTSTIERNFTAKSDPLYEQRQFQKNKLKERNKNIQYIVLSDLQTDEIHNNFEKTNFPHSPNTNKSYIRLRTPHSFIEHDVGIELTTNSMFDTTSIEREVLRFTTSDKGKSAENDRVNFWSLMNSNDNIQTFKTQTKQSVSPSNYITDLSEFETPPPPGPINHNIYAEQNLKQTLRTEKPMNGKVNGHGNTHIPTKKLAEEIFDYETPPPVEKNTKVYGQWTSSKFAGNVLNYLKTINFSTRDQQKIPPTIQLTKISDSYPYASEFKVNKMKVRPSNQFQRRSFMEKRIESNKKDPQINVQILEDDLRSNIIKSHAQTKPKYVEISSRGDLKKKRNERRFYRNVNSQESSENIEEDIYKLKVPKPYTEPLPIKKQQSLSKLTLQSKNLMAILPFLKSLEYFIQDSQDSETKPKGTQDMYTKKFSNANKWHNVKSYSNDYTPRKITLDSDNGQTVVDDKIAEANKRHPAVRLKYKHEERKFVQSNGQREDNILKGRELALQVSNQSNHNTDSVSILKYNHGFLPGHGNKLKITDKINPISQGSTKLNKMTKNSFNKHVKIGNALNERHVIGQSIEQKKQRFVGDETIPDINKYTSDIDNVRSEAPPSLGPRVCKNVELYDRVLYVQPDESIDMTHILSPVRAKNIGIEFILQNYKKCSLAESSLESHVMLFINWSKTPVRLFGGAYPKTTTDLCGFFK